MKQRLSYLLFRRHFLIKRFRKCHYENLLSVLSRGRYLSKRRRPLDKQRGFVVAPFDAFSRVRKEKYFIAFYYIIKIRAAVFRSLFCWKYYKIYPFRSCLRQHKPPCR